MESIAHRLRTQAIIANVLLKPLLNEAADEIEHLQALVIEAARQGIKFTNKTATR